MNLAVVSSINGVPIRLTEERWDHINEERDLQSYFDDVLEAVQSPEFILRGYKGTLIAVVPFGRLGFLHVVYREVNSTDGFIITAYFKRDLDKGRIIWRADQQ
ncbi:MAG: hypothetical protein ABI977_22695 [Acidobacteriota bacterium]